MLKNLFSHLASSYYSNSTRLDFGAQFTNMYTLLAQLCMFSDDKVLGMYIIFITYTITVIDGWVDSKSSCPKQQQLLYASLPATPHYI